MFVLNSKWIAFLKLYIFGLNVLFKITLNISINHTRLHIRTKIQDLFNIKIENLVKIKKIYILFISLCTNINVVIYLNGKKQITRVWEYNYNSKLNNEYTQNHSVIGEFLKIQQIRRNWLIWHFWLKNLLLILSDDSFAKRVFQKLFISFLYMLDILVYGRLLQILWDFNNYRIVLSK